LTILFPEIKKTYLIELKNGQILKEFNNTGEVYTSNSKIIFNNAHEIFLYDLDQMDEIFILRSATTINKTILLANSNIFIYLLENNKLIQKNIQYPNYSNLIFTGEIGDYFLNEATNSLLVSSENNLYNISI